VSDPDSVVPWLAKRRDEWLTAVARWIAGQLGVDVELRSLDAVKIPPWGAVLAPAHARAM
jgi:hypothetical protein